MLTIAAPNRVPIELNRRLNANNQVFIIKLIDFGPVEIIEFNKASNGGFGVRKFAAIAVVSEVINRGKSTPVAEPWSIDYTRADTKQFKRYRVKGVPSKVGDTILIMDAQSLQSTYNSSVKNSKAPFTYYYSPIAVEGPMITDQNYIFISNGFPSTKNGIYYGNIEYGIYPNIKELREAIITIISQHHIE